MTNEEIYYECDKCKKEYLKEHLASYSNENGLYSWELCETCEDHIDYIIRYNINPCSTCVIKGKRSKR